jgi:hypothetical protein
MPVFPPRGNQLQMGFQPRIFEVIHVEALSFLVQAEHTLFAPVQSVAIPSELCM